MAMAYWDFRNFILSFAEKFGYTPRFKLSALRRPVCGITILKSMSLFKALYVGDLQFTLLYHAKLQKRHKEQPKPGDALNYRASGSYGSGKRR
jgi:hypothetical protein